MSSPRSGPRVALAPVRHARTRSLRALRVATSAHQAIFMHFVADTFTELQSPILHQPATPNAFSIMVPIHAHHTFDQRLRTIRHGPPTVRSRGPSICFAERIPSQAATYAATYDLCHLHRPFHCPSKNLPIAESINAANLLRSRHPSASHLRSNGTSTRQCGESTL